MLEQQSGNLLGFRVLGFKGLGVAGGLRFKRRGIWDGCGP